MNRIMPNCPICGSAAYISKDVPDGFYMGWSVGCTAYKQNDGKHKIKASWHYLDSYEECLLRWNRFIESECKEVKVS